jgi:N-acetylmuramoyl-L-alanine amidase
MGGRRMVVRAAAAIAMVALGCIIACEARASSGLAVLSSARIEPRGGAMEMHFGFRGTAPRLNLSAHGNELSIDLSRTATQIPPRPFFGQEVQPVKAVRVMSAGTGRTRIVVEVDGKADYAIARLSHEIVLRVAAAGTVPNIAAPILVRNEPRRRAPTPRSPARDEVEATPEPVALAAAPANPPAHPPAAQTQMALATESEQTVIGHPLVMIDPGHGGHDPGTISASGLQEKDLALAISMRLRDALEARGIRARMTRSSDVFIPLPERTRIANRAGANLFVSVHLNSSPNPVTSGIEVYYLNNTTDRATIRLAKMENAGAPSDYGTDGGPNLNYILTDLRQQYKANEAASLARMIDAQAVANLDAGMGIDVNALGAKMGPFYVLVGAHMPAVLVETGFLSNATEARRLGSAQYQEVLADGIATAIAHYFNADVAVGNL